MKDAVFRWRWDCLATGMRMMGLVWCAAMCAAMGCAVPARPQPVDLWVARQGGVVEGAGEARADRVAHPLIACCIGRPIRVQVLETDAVGAFSWPSGRVFVTRGLLDHLSDAELAAAMAHELGHLLSDGQLQFIAGTRCSCANSDREVRADAAGLQLLGAAGLPQSPMVSMLRKVQASAASTPHWLALQRRILLASERIESVKTPTQVAAASTSGDLKIR